MKTFNRGDAQLEQFVSLFLKERGLRADFTSTLLASDGSTRVFRRITPVGSPVTFVLMENPPVEDSAKRENFAYLMIGRHLHGKGLPLPQIHASFMEKGWFIMEDFGATSLQDRAASGEDRVPLYERVVEVLFHLQVEGAKGFSPSWTSQTEKYDAFVMRRYEADYFRDAFLCDYLGMKREWPELEPPFIHLAEKASLAESRFFLHRDFQSRNIMAMNDRIGVIDWQGGRLGPLGYDLASLLIDPYARLSEEERGRIYRRYVALLEESLPETVESFHRSFPYLALQRNLQILGAFSFLSQVRQKIHFRPYIAPALNSLRQLLAALNDEALSPLRDLALSLEDPSADALGHHVPAS